MKQEKAMKATARNLTNFLAGICVLAAILGFGSGCGSTASTASQSENNPTPTITAISPNSAAAGGAAFTLTVNGTNFVTASVVNFGGTARATTFVSATQLTAAIPADAIAAAGNAVVTVTNPAPGGGTSNTMNLTVGNPTPTITAISPNNALTGGPAFTLTANGMNFVSGSTVNFGGAAPATTFVSSTQLTAAVPATAIASAGAATVTVTNPSPGGGTSNPVNFTISSGPNPVPKLSYLSPTVATFGGSDFTLTVYAVNGIWSFVPSSVVRWNGADRPTAFLAAYKITAQIPASDIAAAGTAAITVFNPAPGGGVSNSLTFTIAPGGVNPRSVAIAPDSTGKFGKFAYVANLLTNNVSMYTINPTTGALTSTGTIPEGNSPLSVAVDPSGNFAYVANDGICDDLIHALGDVSMYTIDATTGTLTSTGTIVAGQCANSVAVDPSGKFAYVANSGDCDYNFGSISTYSINPFNGTLSSTGTINTGYCSQSVAVAPDASGKFGKFAYVANYDNGVLIYTIDLATGLLTPAGTVAAGTNSQSVAVDPSGKFAYATNDGSISMYTINATTGALTSIGTIAAGVNPISIAIDPSGKFAYVANFGSSDVSMYSIDTATGTLTLIGTIGT
jgi:6-phosphogluconolactonase (cycloisomerase 2 family)